MARDGSEEPWAEADTEGVGAAAAAGEQHAGQGNAAEGEGDSVQAGGEGAGGQQAHQQQGQGQEAEGDGSGEEEASQGGAARRKVGRKRMFAAGDPGLQSIGKKQVVRFLTVTGPTYAHLQRVRCACCRAVYEVHTARTQEGLLWLDMDLEKVGWASWLGGVCGLVRRALRGSGAGKVGGALGFKVGRAVGEGVCSSNMGLVQASWWMGVMRGNESLVGLC